MKYGIIELHDNYDFSTPIAPREVVRCKDCKYYRIDDYSGVFNCFFSSNAVTADDFCSFGERRE